MISLFIRLMWCVVQVALDEEVSSEQAESFRRAVARLREPQHALCTFALSARAPAATDLAAPKHYTLKYARISPFTLVLHSVFFINH